VASFYSSGKNNMTIRQSIFSAVLVTSLVASVFATETQVVNSKISEVTVYQDRARVTRVGTVALPQDETVLEFGGLPASLDEGSVEVSPKSNAHVTIQGIDVRQEFLTEHANPQAEVLDRRLQQLEDQKRSLASKRAVLEAKQQFFKDLSAGFGRSDKGQLDLDELRKLYSFCGDEAAVLSENILNLDADSRKLDPEIERVKKELEQLRSAAPKTNRKVLVSVKSDGAGTADFIVRYGIRGASWNSTYDARLDSSSGKVELKYDGMVRQRTGEEWTNVQLVLSTAQPSRNGQMPELNPAFVDYQHEMPLPPAPVAGEMARAMEPAASPTYKAENAEAVVRETGLSLSYQVSLPVTIPTDGEPHRTSVTVLNLEGKPEYVATPKLDAAAFLKVHLTNSSQATLLPGKINLFRDGEFVGSLAMKLVPVGSDFDLYGGRDDAIKVERKELVSKRSETGMLNRKQVEEKRYQISLQDFRSAPVKLSLYDQVPVSKNAEIAVNQGTFSDKPSSLDKDSGKIKWEIELKPKEKKVIEFGYSIEWPKGKDIVGG
jgi:uncharacterized protein (TIGR02231 family)